MRKSYGRLLTLDSVHFLSVILIDLNIILLISLITFDSCYWQVDFLEDTPEIMRETSKQAIAYASGF